MHNGFPIDLILIRHGESEGNLAQEFAKQGDESYWTEELMKKHNSLYRLTSLGQEQAKIAGQWIRDNISTRFDQYYCSEYVRALETAALLGFEGAHWCPEIFLREQDKGVLEGQSEITRKEIYELELKRKEREFVYWAPLGGESIAQCVQRIELWLFELERYCSGFRVLVVCHGDIMKSIRLRLESLRQSEWGCFQTDPDYRTYNCSLVHYSRRHPVTGDVHSRMCFVRSICPWDLSKTSCKWKQLPRIAFTNEELLNIVNNVPRYCDDPSRVTRLIVDSPRKSNNSHNETDNNDSEELIKKEQETKI